MKTLIALACLGCGFIGSQVLPFPYGPLAFIAAVIGGYCVLLRKTRRNILRFGQLTWTLEEICRHILITGDTGSGKTKSGLQSILFQLTVNVPNWGGLVLSSKGNEPEYIRQLMTHFERQNDVITLKVRPSGAGSQWQPPHRFNLLSDSQLSWMAKAKLIGDVAASMVEGEQHAFFRPMTQISLSNAFELIHECGLPVTISRAYEILSSREVAERYLQKFSRINSTPRQQELTRFFRQNFTEAKAHEQYEAVIGTITTYLNGFLTPEIAEVFSSDEPNTFSFSEIDYGRVITVEIPQALLVERRIIQTFLKIYLYHHALRRLDKSSDRRSLDNLLLLVGDEFQDLITASNDGMSDHNNVDKLREAKLAIIAGMQSELSADPVVGERKRKVFSLNLRTRFNFCAAAPEDAEICANFIGKRTVWKRSKTSQLGKLGSTTRRQELEYYIKPEKLLRLPKHTAVVVHPSKRFVRKRIAPIDGRGKVYPWYW